MSLQKIEEKLTIKEFIFFTFFIFLTIFTLFIPSSNSINSLEKSIIVYEFTFLKSNNFLTYQDVNEKTCNGVLKSIFNLEANNNSSIYAVYVNNTFAKPKDISLRHLLCSHEKNYLQFIKY